MVRFDELNAETTVAYRNEIAQFYYENMKTQSSFESYSFNQAYEKIGDLIDHLNTKTCIAYGAFEGSEIIGYIWAYPHIFREEARMYISECSVKEGYRDRGIGKAMIALVEKKTK